MDTTYLHLSKLIKFSMFKLICLSIFLLPFVTKGQSDTIKIFDINKAAYKVLKVGVKPDFIALDGDDAWVVDDHQSRVIKISPDTDSALLIVLVPEACTAPIVGFNALWVMSCTEKTLYRIDHNTGAIVAKIATGMAEGNGEMSLAVADGSVWLLSDSSGILIRVDPKTNTIQKRIIVLPNSYGVAFGNDAIWVSNHLNNSVQKVSVQTNAVIATIPVGLKPRFIAATNNNVWTLNQGDGTVSKIDAGANKVIATINVKAVGGGGDIAADLNKVWVVSTNPEVPLQTIDVNSNAVTAIYQQSHENGRIVKVDGAVRISDKFVWVSGYYSKNIWILKR